MRQIRMSGVVGGLRDTQGCGCALSIIVFLFAHLRISVHHRTRDLAS